MSGVTAGEGGGDVLSVGERLGDRLGDCGAVGDGDADDGRAEGDRDGDGDGDGERRGEADGAWTREVGSCTVWSVGLEVTSAGSSGGCFAKSGGGEMRDGVPGTAPPPGGVPMPVPIM